MRNNLNSAQPASNVTAPSQVRTYTRSESVVFLKTKERFGGLSNMASGFPLRVNGVYIRTSEALYQACRFPHLPDVQRLIIDEASPMTAKMKSKPYRQDSRPDWDRVRVKIMRWCLRVKLAQNWHAFSSLLLSTGDRPIVEESRKDDFWGAKPTDKNTLVGMNVLGRLLMELREESKTADEGKFERVDPLQIGDFLLLGDPIAAVEAARPRRALAVLSATAEHVVIATGQQQIKPTAVNQRHPLDFDGRTIRQGGDGLITSLKPYAQYRESGSPWLGGIPRHWGLSRLGAVLRERGETNEFGRVTQVLSVLKDIGVTRYEEKGRIGNKKSEDIRRYKVVQPDDIVVNCMNVIIGSVGMSRYTGCLSPVYYVLIRRRSEDHPGYLNLVFKTKPFQQSLVRISNGILAHRMRIPMELLKCEPFPLPPADEQAAIVRFLDYANIRIDQFIRAKMETIDLLSEQKHGILQRTATRGLDPNVSFRPSGLPWLGDIPEHWAIWQIGRFARVGNGSTPSRAKPLYWTRGTYPWLNSSQVNRGFINSADQFVTDIALQECHLPKVPARSILVAITGQGKTRGMSALLGMEATISQHLAFITLTVPVASPEFVHLALTASYQPLRALSDDSGSTKGALTCEDLKHFKIGIPPIEEQGKLLRYVEGETRSLAAAIHRVEREISLAREYRTRLIADVVTGKLDVREAARHIPAEIDEQRDVAPLDDAEEVPGLAESYA